MWNVDHLEGIFKHLKPEFKLYKKSIHIWKPWSKRGNLEIAEYDVSSMSLHILKPDTGHGPEMEESGQLHVSATLPRESNAVPFLYRAAEATENLPLQGYETRIVQAVG
jgi:hypothetical protein